PRLPGADQRGAAAVVGPGLQLGRRAGAHAAPLPPADQREPLGADPLERAGLEPGGAGLLRPARPGGGAGSGGAALVTLRHWAGGAPPLGPSAGSDRTEAP